MWYDGELMDARGTGTQQKNISLYKAFQKSSAACERR